MTKAELIAQAFGRGLAQGLTGGQEPGEPVSASLPPVIPMDSIKAAVREVLQPLIDADEAPPRGDQLDMFTHGIENVEPDEDAERIRLRVEEARMRREEAAQTERVRPGEYDPNAPNLSGWTSPSES